VIDAGVMATRREEVVNMSTSLWVKWSLPDETGDGEFRA
jgi:hypothetical protein